MELSSKENITLTILGVIVHLIFLSSIFDIYFTSPLVHGMTPERPQIDPPAKRLVLFSMDGLRADKCFQRGSNGAYRTPFLRSVIQSRGSWGISHTRVPTESRPGHVAITAGFYEDVSAVTKGWQENPVTFDSVFNESTFTWAWGSPEVVPMFSKSDNSEHVFQDVYGSDVIDFVRSDASMLDVWVFQKVNKFFKLATHNQTLSKMLRSDGVVFFLHLIGIDTNGHGYRPDSEEYLKNIQLVDEGIKNISLLFETYFDDDKTAFIATSDHGMTFWGTHGAGHASETLTPLVAWGAGINGPQSEVTPPRDSLSKDWQLDQWQQIDVLQGDIAPLMSTLLGIAFPMNSEGVLPLSYLNMSQGDLALSLFANAKQIMAQYAKKEMLVKERSLFFRPFNLSVSGREDYLRQITSLIKNGHYDEAIRMSQSLIRSSLAGLRYYHTYKRMYLSFLVVFGFLGWILNLVLLIVTQFTSIGQKTKTLSRPEDTLWASRIVSGSAVLFIVFMLYEGDPIQNFVYSLTPLPLWYQLLKQYRLIVSLFKVLTNEPTRVCTSLVTAGVFLCYLELLVASFFFRSFLTLACVLLAIQPFTSKTTVSMKHVIPWSALVVAVGLFPLLPVISGTENYALVYSAGVVFILGAIVVLFCDVMHVHPQHVPHGLVVIMLLCLWVKYCVVEGLKAKKGSYVGHKLFSWSTLFFTPLISLLTDKNGIIRIFSITIATTSIYLLLSISHELLFFCMLVCCFFVWLNYEIQIRQKKRDRKQELSLEDLRTCLTFLTFVILSFFGTGNIASVNSFEITSLYCFATVLSPFIMGALLLLKVCLPLILLNLFFSSMHLFLQIPRAALFSVILIMTDLMSIHFFFLVKDSGSWLDIGTSISHFVIVLGLTIFLIPIFYISEYVCGSVKWSTLLRKDVKFS